jgi:multidrug efflux pump
VNSTIRASGQQLLADVDRDKAEILGVPVQDAYNTLQTMFGSLYVSQFPKDSRLYQVVLQAEPKSRLTPEDIGRFYVKNKSGEMVPLSAIVNTKYVVGPDLVTRFNNYPAIAINGAAAPGVSSGAAIQAIREVVEETMPPGYGYDWAGEAREQISAGSTSALAMVFGLVFVFLILAAQYESWSLPVGVLLAVPFAIFGALVAILLRGIDNDLYFQIGLLTLIGLAAKNAILIVEFAVELNHKEGMSYYDAAVEAARLRLRPIIMTSFAFILGVVPLAIATGASANSRQSIGTGVIGGTLAATVIAIFFIPMFYAVLATWSAKYFGGKKAASAAQGHAADAAPDAAAEATTDKPGGH